MPLSDEQSEVARFVEAFGSYYVASGLPRTAGRLIGWLLVCDPPGQSTSDLIASLGTSKSSISTIGRLVEQAGLVTRYRRPGSRETHYRIAAGAWQTLIERRGGEIAKLRRLADNGLDFVGDGPRSDRLREMRDAFLFWEREWPALIERWQKETT